MNSLRTLMDKLTLLESIQATVYHGSTSEYDELKLNQGSAYFTSDPDVAKSYGDNVTEYKVTLNKPAIVYANNENWNTMMMFNEIDVAGKRITVGELFNNEYDEDEFFEASTIAHELQRVYAVDGVMFKDIIDTGANVETFASSDVYVVFNTSQIQK